MEDFVKKRLQDARISATSLIFTIFGDTIAVHSGSVWLSSVIDVMEKFGVNERLVRTSVYRLVKDGLLESEKIGRCSYYRFSDEGKRHSTIAAERIYASVANDSAHEWTLAITHQASDAKKLDELKRGLDWLGFSQLKPSVYGHPSGDLQALEDLLAQYELTDMVVLFSASPSNNNSQNNLKQLVYDKWSLDEVTLHYKEFCQTYRSYMKKVQQKKLSPEDAFLLRTMLIHEYRRVLLRDPQLPEEMLPVKWEGFTAHQISKSIYLAITSEAEQYVREHFENAQGKLPGPSRVYQKRFGGLNN